MTKPKSIKYLCVNLSSGEITKRRNMTSTEASYLNKKKGAEGRWVAESTFDWWYKKYMNYEADEHVEELLRLSAMLPPIPVETRSPVGSGLDPKLMEGL